MWTPWRNAVDRFRKRWCQPALSPAGSAREWQPVEKHAEQLVEWLWRCCGEYPRAFPEIVIDYRAMCQDRGWYEHPWKIVAARLTSITTGRKVYERRLVAGRSVRLRVYPVVDVVERGMAQSSNTATAQPAADAPGIDAMHRSSRKRTETA
jgi:hypothetical protein